MRISIPTVITAVLTVPLFIHPMPASAQLETFIEICGSAKAHPSEVVKFCQRALDTGRLDERAAAQVRANMGVGFSYSA